MPPKSKKYRARAKPDVIFSPLQFDSLDHIDDEAREIVLREYQNCTERFSSVEQD